jgi:hypothetical protein
LAPEAKEAPTEADAPAVFQTESLHAALSAGLCRGIPVHFGFLACSFGCRHLVSGDNGRCEGNGETQSSNHQNQLLHCVLLLVQVSHEALRDHADRVHLSGTDSAIFEAYRELIEDVASETFDAEGPFDDHGRLLVTSEALARVTRSA